MSLFKKVLSQCVAKGMVRGKRQAIDSAFIKANASMDSLLEKEVIADAAEYASEFNEYSEFQVSASKTEETHSGEPEQTAAAEATEAPQNCISIRPTDDHGRPLRPMQVSNTTHHSQTDPDARVSVKPGKPRQLNYYGQIAVDDAHHIITGAMADYADKRDSECLPAILSQTMANLSGEGLPIDQIVADTNYSSGSALRFCEDNNIDAYIPNTGPFLSERKGFLFNKEQNQYECQRGNKAILHYKGIRNNTQFYRSSQTACNHCPFQESCCGTSVKYKRIGDTIDKPYYDRMDDKLKKGRTAQIMSRIRSRTVEPVLGTLINYRNMKRVNTRGIHQANKHVLMAALSYNLKKLLHFMQKRVRIMANALPIPRGIPNSSSKSALTLAFLSKMSFLLFDPQKIYRENRTVY